MVCMDSSRKRQEKKAVLDVATDKDELILNLESPGGVVNGYGLLASQLERVREKGIHLIWVTHDLFDPRIVSRQGVRDQVNRYMRTVFKEEPLDPSLEVLHDEHSW